MKDKPFDIAVIGAGVSGIVAAHILSRAHNVTLFEKNERLGGHTNTVRIPSGVDEGLGVDTGFIVLNDKTYPNFHRFLAQLKVDTRCSCMSFGYICEETGFVYAGTNLNGLIADRFNILNRSFWGMLIEARRFSREAIEALENGALAGVSLGEFLDRRNFSSFFKTHYLIPISAAIWSSSDKGIMEFPAEMFVRFFQNHGLLSLNDRPSWQTVAGGSHSYLKAFEKQFSGSIKLSSPVQKIERQVDCVDISKADGSGERFDKVVIASHADEALAMLADPSDEEKESLGAWSYSNNRTVLHTFEQVLPANRRAWASWNYRRTPAIDRNDPVAVTYHMNRLQGIDSSNQYCVTLNPNIPIPDEQIIKEIEYTHPIFSLSALESQDKIKKLSGVRNTYYCGAYLGYGFHEDGVNSGLDVGEKFGLSL